MATPRFLFRPLPNGSLAGRIVRKRYVGDASHQGGSPGLPPESISFHFTGPSAAGARIYIEYGPRDLCRGPRSMTRALFIEPAVCFRWFIVSSSHHWSGRENYDCLLSSFVLGFESMIVGRTEICRGNNALFGILTNVIILKMC